MFDIGGGELLLILLAILLLFGPKKIPEIMRMFGKGLGKIKQAQTELKQQIREIEKEVEAPLEDIKNEIEKQ
ncbi:MAG: Sec-independent protein translocase subunit TatA/TatB [Candidatus Kapaibacterium sp.]|jgi:TatA/E family protein of Tat protein translocase